MALLEGLQLGTPSGIGDLAGAASATVGSPQATADQAAKAIQNIMQARLGPGGGTTVGPQAPTPILPLPPSQPQMPGIPQGPFGSVGQRKRADTQALFGGIASIVQKAQEKHYEMKVQKLQHDFEKLSGAMRGYQEGQATGNKEQMQQNSRIINEMFADPKTSKEFSKAFDVNLNPMAQDKGKGKPSPEQDAMKRAFAEDMKKFQNKETMLSPQASAMMRQMPQVTQMDPRLAVQAQLVKDKLLPTADAQVTAISKIADATIQGQSRLDASSMNKQAALLLSAALMSSRRLSEATKIRLEKDRHLDKMLEIQENHRLAMKELNPLKQADMLTRLSKNAEDIIGGVKVDNNGNVSQSSGLQGEIRRVQKDIDDAYGAMSFGGRANFMSGRESLANLDQILTSKHPFLHYGLTDADMEKLKQIRAMQKDQDMLRNEIKSLEGLRIGIGKTLAGVAEKGVYGGNTGPTSDSTGVSGESNGDSTDDGTDDKAVDILERSFDYPADQQSPDQ